MANKINLRRTSGHQKKINKSFAGRFGVSSDADILQQALTHHRAGCLSQAEVLYRQILARKPNHPEALRFLGLLAHQVGKIEVAVELLGKALACRPDYLEAHCDLGNVLKDQGKLDAAAASYRRALALKPDFAEMHSNLGNLFMAQGKIDEAVASFRQALALKPGYAVAHYNLGNALKEQDKLTEAVACYRQALVLKPDYVYALNNLGLALNYLGKFEEAVACFRHMVALRPDFAEAHNNLGNVFSDQGKFEEAFSCYHRALDLKPDFADAHNNLGNAFRVQGRLDEAVANFRQAICLKPNFPEAFNNLGNVLKARGKFEEAVASYSRALSLQPDYAEAHSNLLLCLNYLPGQSVGNYLEEARRYGRIATDKVGTRFSDWRDASHPKRLRVGFVSGDFWNHPVGYFLENLLKNIDPARIALIAYPTHYKEDELTRRIRPRFIAWKPLLGMNDEAAARLIHDEGVHVLFDLAGHTSYNRLPVFAWKPAPVQVSWLGYSASTGLTEMDYLLADPYVVLPGEEANFTETIWRLPESYLCFTPPQVTLPVGPLPALKEGRITFGCFNNPTKMNDSVVSLWAEVLHAVPDSRLFLKAKRFSDPAFCETTRQRFAEVGIASDRLVLEGFVRHRHEHLAAYNRVDIALDPFPYNGTTTCVEGLWMGVPFITRRGNCFVSHVGESIAHNARLADWIAMDAEDYVAKAAAHTADLDKLAHLRARLRQQMLASPLLDGPRFARHFETAMWGMWRRFRAER